MKLTKDNIGGLTVDPGKPEKRFMDDEVPGFGLRVRATGARTWFITYRDRAGKSCAKMLGPVKKVSLAQARAQAKVDMAKVTLNGDPQQEKKLERDRAAQTFDSITPGFLDHQKANTKPLSYAQVKLHITDHWSPFAKRSVHSITAFDVSEQLGKIAKDRGPIAANRARATLSSFFGWAMGEGLAAHNPVVGTNKPMKNEIARERVLTDAELAKIWKATKDDDYGRIVRLLMLTGQRRDEVGAIVKSEISVPDCRWNIPSARTKNGRTHEVPLSDTALDILKAALKVEGREDREVIFGETDNGFSGWSKCKEALDQRIKDAAGKALVPWRLHDLRRTVATRMADLGVLPHVIEAVLNHISGHKGGIAGVYNRASYAAEKRQALDTLAAHIEAIAAGKPASNVVAMKA